MYVKTISFSIVTAYILMDGIGMLPSFALPTNIFSLLGSDVLYSIDGSLSGFISHRWLQDSIA